MNEEISDVNELFGNIKRVRNLKGFTEYLDKELGFKFNPDKPESRTKIQKYVFIAEQFGFQSNYSFDKQHVDAPYSEELSKDYYSKEFPKIGSKDLDENLEQFIELVKGKDTEWLTVAAKIIATYNNNKQNNYLGELEKLTMEETIKATDVDEEFVEDVFYTLRGTDAINQNI